LLHEAEDVARTVGQGDYSEMTLFQSESKQAPRRSASRSRGLGVVLAMVLLAGCIDPVEPLPVLGWQGQLEPTGTSDLVLSGSVAMVANQFSTQVGIGVTAGPENTAFRWVVRAGSCQTPGSPLASEDLFPILELDDAGRGRAEFVLNQRISVTGTFTAQVLSTSGQVVACGNLTRPG
jgi:hypothetical protein